MSSIKFKRGQNANLNNVPVDDGSILFTEDTARIYLDTNGERKEIHGNIREQIETRNFGENNIINSDVIGGVFGSGNMVSGMGYKILKYKPDSASNTTTFIVDGDTSISEIPAGSVINVIIDAMGARIGTTTNSISYVENNTQIVIDSYYKDKNTDSLISSGYLTYDEATGYYDVTGVVNGSSLSNYLMFPELTKSDGNAYGTVATGAKAFVAGSKNKSWVHEANIMGAQNSAEGRYSLIAGRLNKGGYGALVGGRNNEAFGDASFAVGTGNKANGLLSAALGDNTKALGDRSLAEGWSTTASGSATHAEGKETIAEGYWSHAEGIGTKVQAVEGYEFYYGEGSHAEGGRTIAASNFAHAEGLETKAYGSVSHAEGVRTQALGTHSHAEGLSTVVSGKYSHVEGNVNKVYADSSHGEGMNNTITADSGAAHVEGSGNTVSGWNAHAEGANNVASGPNSHVEGNGINTASANGAHAEGFGGSTASASGAHAEGYKSTASGKYSHAEGTGGTASNIASHVEGEGCTADGYNGHAEGYQTKATGDQSHAQNAFTEATGLHSSAAGYKTVAGYEQQFVVGKFNNNKEDTLFEVGNGTSTKKSNAFEVKLNGDIYANNYLVNTHYGVSDPAVQGLIAEDYYNGTKLYDLREHKGSTILVHRYNSELDEWYKLTIDCQIYAYDTYEGDGAGYVEVVDKFIIKDAGLPQNEWQNFGWLHVEEYDGNVCSYDIYDDLSPAKKVLDPRYIPTNIIASDIKEDVSVEIDNKLANLVDSAPETLDTLNELAAALGDDPDFATTVSNRIGLLETGKVDKVEGKGLSTNDFTDVYKTKLDNLDGTITDSITPITDEEIDTICAMTFVDANSVLTDESTGTQYVLYVLDGDLKMTEVAE